MISDLSNIIPSAIYVNGNYETSNSKTCNLVGNTNNITLEFENEINSCENMFSGLTNIKEVDLSYFDTSKVTNMANMFLGCSNLIKINLWNINTTLVENMSGFFKECKNLISIDLSYFDTSSVTNMHEMFSNCKKIKSIDASSFNTSKVTNIGALFGYCDNLIEVNISNFDISKVINMGGMFIESKKLKYLDASSFGNTSLNDMNYMFSQVESLVYLNFKNFKINNISSIEAQQFLGAPTKVKHFCNNDQATIDYLNTNYEKNNGIYKFTSDCSSDCFKENTKIYINDEVCTENCPDYSYNNICRNDCPKDTYKISKDNSIICSDIIPENYYLDKNNNNISKPCNENCKKCFGEGDEINNNCKECFPNYIVINITNEIKNCLKCDYYYYHDDSTNKYMCTNDFKCPENYKFLIPERRECISKCKNDNNYTFEYNNTCYKQCPNNTYYKNNYICYDYTESKETVTDNEISTFQNDFKNGDKEDIINNITDNNEIYSETIGDTILYLSTVETQKNSSDKNMSTIDLGECANELKIIYNINESQSLIMLKVDYFSNDSLIPIIGYEIYEPNNFTLLDLSLCNSSEVKVFIPVKIDEDNLFLYDPNSEFYKSNCYAYTTENGTDIIVRDRQKQYGDKNLSLCENNCNYMGYDSETKQSFCVCKIKNQMETISEIINNTNKLLNDFKSYQDSSRSSSKISIECANVLFTVDGIKNNISSYILLIITFYFLCSLLWFMKCFFSLLKMEIRNIISKIEKKEKREKTETTGGEGGGVKKIKKKIKNINSPPQKTNIKFIGNTGSGKRYRRQIKSNAFLTKSIKNLKSISNNNEIENKDEQNQERSIKNIINTKKNNIITKIDLNDYELNTLEYSEAILYDKRTFCDYYFSLIKTKQPLIFAFCPINDYNLFIIKSCIFFLSFSVYYAINYFFFDEETIHKIYVAEGKYILFDFLPEISISFVCSHVITIIIKYIFLSERNLKEIKKQKTLTKASNMSYIVEGKLRIKYILFYIIGFIFLILFWVFISSFGAVFQNTQVILAKNTAISFAVSFIFPFFINVIPSIFRSCSLSDKENNSEYLYNLSKFIQLI